MSGLVESIQRNAVILAISLFLSWLIWYQVRLELTDEALITATVSVDPPDQNVVVLEKPRTVEATIRGPRDEIARIVEIGEISLRFNIGAGEVDETELEQRTRFTARDAIKPPDFGDNLRVAYFEPFVVRFTAIDSKEVPVIAPVDAGELPADRKPNLGEGSRIEARRRVRIRGPAAAVGEISTLTAEVIRARDRQPPAGSTTSEPFDVPIDRDASGLPDDVTIEGDGRATFELRWTIEQSKMGWVSLEVHWIFPPGEKPASSAASDRSILFNLPYYEREDIEDLVQEDASTGRVKLRVHVIGDPLPAKGLDAIQAYVRSDDVFASEANFSPVYFANVPAGVRVQYEDAANDNKVAVIMRDE